MDGYGQRYDGFLSYNWRDHAVVEPVAEALRARGLDVFLDRWYLTPGHPWPQALEESLDRCRAAAVFLGPGGMGPWQQREKDLALDRQAREPDFGVVPVLLPGADPALGFLALNTWVDLRNGPSDREAVEVLASALQGRPPGPDLAARLRATVAQISPYRGLRPFREEDAPFFFGREVFTERLTAAVARRSLVAVVGASGSGKSSVVRAGLVPRLRRGDSGSVWEVRALVPGDRPFQALAAALVPLLEPAMTETDRLVEVGKLTRYLAGGEVSLGDVVARALEKQPGTDRLLLVVDQWEELYTLGGDPVATAAFVDALLAASDAGRLTVVATLRGDFFGRALAYRPLADRLQDAVVPLGPMTRDELTRAIVEPARKLGLTFEAGLTERLLDDVGAEPGNLPLLEFVLTGLWEARRGGQLHHEAYAAMGGVQGAMAQRAEAVLAGLSPPEQGLLRRTLVRLVRPGEGTEDTRRRARLAELEPAAVPLVRRLADARLVVTAHDAANDQETVEVAHEALIRHWQRLRSWLDEDRAFLLWRQRLRMALDLHREADGDGDLLLRGAPLAEAERRLIERPGELSADEQAFIEASSARREAEQRARERMRRRIVGTLALATLVSLIMAAVALWGWKLADERRAEALRLAGHQLALQAQLVAQDPGGLETSVLLALHAMRTFPTPLAEQLLRDGIALLPRLVAAFDHALELRTMAVDADGSTLATASPSGQVKLWRRGAGSPQVLAAPSGRSLAGLALDPAGERLVAWYYDKQVQVLALPQGEVLADLVHDSLIMPVIAPGGRWLASAALRQLQVWDLQGGVRVLAHDLTAPLSALGFDASGDYLAAASSRGAAIFDLAAGRLVGQVEYPRVSVRHLGVTPDGKRVYLVPRRGGALQLWQVDTGQVAATAVVIDSAAETLVFDRDAGRLLVVEPQRLAVRQLDGAGDPAFEHPHAVAAAALGPDGRYLAAADVVGGMVRVWRVETGQEVSRLRQAGVSEIHFSADGAYLATAGRDRVARLWVPGWGWDLPGAAGGAVLALGPRGRQVAVGHSRLRIVDAQARREVAAWALPAEVSAAGFAPDGRALVAATVDGQIRLWTLPGGEPAGPGLSMPGARIVQVGTDGRAVTALDELGRLRRWDGITGRELGGAELGSDALAVALSGDGQRVAEIRPGGPMTRGGPELTAAVRDLAMGSSVLDTTFGGSFGGDPTVQVRRAVLDIKGDRLAVLTSDGSLWLLNAVGEPRPVRRLAVGREAALVAFAAEGELVLVGDRQGTVQLWETATGDLQATVQTHMPLSRMTLAADGRQLVSASTDGQVRHQWLSGSGLLAEACRHVVDDLGPAQWARYLGDQPRRPACPDLPVR